MKQTGGKQSSMNCNDQGETSSAEKKKQLFLKQKETLDIFLEHGAISNAQYIKSLGDLMKKMKIDTNGE